MPLQKKRVLIIPGQGHIPIIRTIRLIITRRLTIHHITHIHIIIITLIIITIILMAITIMAKVMRVIQKNVMEMIP